MIIELEDGTKLEFPDGTSDADIAAAVDEFVNATTHHAHTRPHGRNRTVDSGSGGRFSPRRSLARVSR